MDLIIDVLNENEQLKSRIEYLERKIQRERNSTQKQYAKWEKEAETKIKELSKENEQLKKQIERIDFILDDLNGAEYISRDDGIKALNKIDKVIGKR